MQSSVVADASGSGAQAAGRSLHESLIELLPDPLLALDLEVGRFVLANVAAERLLGTPRNEVYRLGLRDLIRPWDIGQLAHVEAALRAEGRWRGELWLRRQDGTFIPTDVSAQTWNLDGRTLAQLSCRDATERWRDDAIRRVVGDAAERLAGATNDRDALRTVVTSVLPGLAEAALVELDAVDDGGPISMLALADPLSPSWPAITVNEHPNAEACNAVRRGSILSIPLTVPGRRLGQLTLRRPSHRRWEAGEQPLIEELARHAAHAIDQARQARHAREELDDRGAMLRLLAAIDMDITPRGVFEMLIEEAQAVLPADDGGAARYDPERELIHPAFPLSMDSCKVVDKKLMVAIAANERCPLIENDYQRTMGKNTPAGRVGAKAVLAVPMLHRDRLVGSVSLSQITSTRRFQPRHARRLMALAAAAATTIAGMERQRAHGARLAVREAAHLVNNDLTLTMGSLDVMRSANALPSTLIPLVETALDGVTRAAAHIAELQRATSPEACRVRPKP